METMDTNEDIAEAKKNEGNIFYKNKEYPKAIQLYSEAISSKEDAGYFLNRGAAYMMLERYTEALKDVQQAIKLGNNTAKAYLREAKCHIALGSADSASKALDQVIEVEPDNKQALQEKRALRILQIHTEAAEAAIEKGDYRKVLYDLGRAIEQAPACPKFKVQRAEALLKLRRFAEAQETINAVLMKDALDSEAIYVRGLSLYYQDSLEKAQQHFQQVLRLNPDNSKARIAFKKCRRMKQKKDEGNEAFKKVQYKKAYDLYTEALEIDEHNVLTNAKLYCNRALVGSKLQKLEQAVADCSKAIELDDNYLKAYHRRAKCYQDSELFEEAVRDYEKICQMDRTRENQRLLKDAKLELKKSKRKDYYKLLSISKNATEDEIKKAYRKHALLHHPDRHASKTPQERKAEEIKFKEVGEAYNVLSDKQKRAKYDSGQDLEDMDGPSFDPNDLFQTFFGGSSGGFPFSFGAGPGHSHGGGYPGGHYGGGGGFPGGFQFQFG